MKVDFLLRREFKSMFTKKMVFGHIAAHIIVLSVAFAVTTSPNGVAAQDISGIHEVVFGVSDLEEAKSYWTRFGYHVADEGNLSEDEAMALYHVPSAAKVLRMAHMDTDHTFVRLWQWANETGPGAGI